jgi:hypothetical protein
MRFRNFRALAVPSLYIALVSCANAQVVSLANGTGTFSQYFTGIWNASELIDGDFSANNGWAIFRGGPGLFPSNYNFTVNEVVIRTVPEPASVVAVALGEILLRRKRRK